VSEYVLLLKEYRVTSLVGDNYSGAWAEEAFKKSGIRYIRSEHPKSELYLESLPLWMRNAITIPNHPRLVRELRLLERRTSRIGKDVIDHGRNGSDDYANAVCGACVMAASRAGPITIPPEVMAWSKIPYSSKVARHRMTRQPRAVFGTHNEI